MTQTLTWLDGVGCPDGRGSLRLDDLVLISGLGVFETLRTYGGVPFRLGTHLARLRASAAFCGLDCPPEVEPELIAAAEAIGVEAKLNVILTGSGHRIVRAEPLDLSRSGAPVRIATRPWSPSPWLPGRVKHTSRAGWILAARQAGVEEVLWLAPDGCWTEANRSNLFVVRDGVLLTPPDDGRILQGITRDCLLEAARAIGVPVEEVPVPAGPCEEMYLSSTLKELAPVEELDGYGVRGAGPIGAAVLGEFRRRFAAIG